MDFATIFRLEENLNLDKKTLVFLRWIAIFGQLFSVNLVYFFLDLNFPVLMCHIVIFVGLLTNLYLQFGLKATLLKDLYSSSFLMYDIFQLSILLFLTGGIFNPFAILLIVPTIVSSTFLSMGSTIILGSSTIILLFVLTFFKMPLPGMEEYVLSFPNYYVTGILISLIIGLLFLSYFGIRFAGETKKRSDALNKLQQILAKEYELESLGGQAAAAAHSLGTPLATISVVSKELRKEVGDNSKLTRDIDLLISQTKRCSEILKDISQKKIINDEFLSSMSFEDLLEAIIKSFKESSEKNITLNTDKDINKIFIKKNPELVYGLRNFIGNAVKFSYKNVLISIISNNINLYITIEDDGPGFPEDIIKTLGEPYIKSRSSLLIGNAGLGLGTFLGKTLLERQSAIISFENNSSLSGAKVKIQWRINDLNSSI
jgi:two-component system sensor histidine kinase RegB